MLHMLVPLVCATTIPSIWSVKRAQDWGQSQKWSVGCNYIPSNAINQLEMWQPETFDLLTIDREFALMEKTGMSVARIYLHDKAHEADSIGFKDRMRAVIGSAKQHKIRIIFVLFDDCWNPKSELGTQPKPVPGVHNSGWLRSPADNQRNWPTDFNRLKLFVHDVVGTFRKDKTVWMWDVYNEPGNSDYGSASLPLLRNAFAWAREAKPDQPVTAAAFGGGENEIDRTCLELSDVITFHCYDDLKTLKSQISHYQSFGRPVICTEWMARTNDSKILTHLPAFQETGVSCLQWGFVSGKTNTIFPWGSKPNSPEPKVWFHDLFRHDGIAFDPAEVDCYQRLTKVSPKKHSVLGSLPIIPNQEGVIGLRRVLDIPLRDPSICRGKDGLWVMTGTVEPFYGFNEGIKIWTSKDFRSWKSLGFVWKYGKSEWHQPFFEKKMSLWAPEVHFKEGTYWLTYSMPSYVGFNEHSSSGLLRSISGKPEGPYEDMNSKSPFGDEIDGSLFQEDDGSMYYVWHSGKIGKLNKDRTGFDGPTRRLTIGQDDPFAHHHSSLCARIFGPNSFDHIGYEGAFLFKRKGIYYLIGSEMIDGRYSCMVATSKSLYGPYSARYEAIPHGGHPYFFQDERGEWWVTLFGSDATAPLQEKPGIVPIRFAPDGRLTMDYR